MRTRDSLCRTLPCLVCLCGLVVVGPGCFEDVAPIGDGESSGDGDGDPSGDGDGDPSGDGDGDPSGDGDGDPSGDGDGDPAGDGDGDGDPSGDGDGDGDPGPMCNAPQTACGDVCVTLDADPMHCGACDHGCLGGACSSGVCAPVQLASGKGRLFMAVVDDTHLYYGGDGANVGRIDKNGQNDTILAAAGPMTTDKEWCYQSTRAGNTVVWGNDWVQPGVRGCNMPDCAGGVQTFMPGLNLYAMAYDEANSRLYWTQGDNIATAAWPGGMMTSFAGAAPRELATDGSFVYWASQIAVNDYRVRKRSVGGGNVIELAINRPTVTALAVTPTKVIWAETDQILEAALPNGIGGANPDVFADVGSIRNIVVDDTHVYWTSNQNNVGTVGRCPIAGCDGPPEVVAQIAKPWGITYDANAIYFVTENGAIMRWAK